MEGCNFPCSLGNRKSLDVVASVCLRHFESFNVVDTDIVCALW